MATKSGPTTQEKHQQKTMNHPMDDEKQHSSQAHDKQITKSPSPSSTKSSQQLVNRSFVKNSKLQPSKLPSVSRAGSGHHMQSKLQSVSVSRSSGLKSVSRSKLQSVSRSRPGAGSKLVSVTRPGNKLTSVRSLSGGLPTVSRPAKKGRDYKNTFLNSGGNGLNSLKSVSRHQQQGGLQRDDGNTRNDGNDDGKSDRNDNQNNNNNNNEGGSGSSRRPQSHRLGSRADRASEDTSQTSGGPPLPRFPSNERKPPQQHHHRSGSVPNHHHQNLRHHNGPGSSPNPHTPRTGPNDDSKDEGNMTKKSSPKKCIPFDNEFVLQNLIRSQIEYLFSDYHLTNDTYLLARMQDNDKHWLSVDELCHNQKIRCLTNKKDRILQALRESKYLQLSPDDERVRRPDFTLPKLKPNRDLRRTVFLYGIPPNKSEQDIRQILSQHGHIKRIHFEPDHPVDDDPSSPGSAVDDEAPNTAVAQLLMRKKFLFPTRYQSDGQSDTESHKSGFTAKSMEGGGGGDSFHHPCRHPSGDPQDFSHLITAFVVFESQSQATKCVKARVRSMDGMRCIHKYDYNKVAKKFRTAQMKGEKLSFSPPPPNFQGMLQHQHSGGRDYPPRGMSPSGHRNYNDHGNNRSYRDNRGRYNSDHGSNRGYESYRNRSGNPQDNQFRRNYQQRYNNRDRDRGYGRDRGYDRNDRDHRNDRYNNNNNNNHRNDHYNNNYHSGSSNPNQSPFYNSGRRKNSDDFDDERNDRRRHQHNQPQSQHGLGPRSDRQSYDNKQAPPQNQSDRFRRVGNSNNNQSYSSRRGNMSGSNSSSCSDSSFSGRQFSAGNQSTYSVGNQSNYSSGNPQTSVGNQSTRSANTVQQSRSKPDQRMQGPPSSGNGHGNTAGNDNGNSYNNSRNNGSTTHGHEVNNGRKSPERHEHQQQPQQQQQTRPPQEQQTQNKQQTTIGDTSDLQHQLLNNDGNLRLKDSTSATMPSRGPDDAPFQRPTLKRSHSAKPVASGTTHSSVRQQQQQKQQQQQQQNQGNQDHGSNRGNLGDTKSNPVPSRHAQLAKDAADLQAAGYPHELFLMPDDLNLPGIEDINFDLKGEDLMSGYEAYFGVDGNTAQTSQYNKLKLTHAHSAQSSTRWDHIQGASAGAANAYGYGQNTNPYGGYSTQQLTQHLPQLGRGSYSAQSPASYQQQQPNGQRQQTMNYGQNMNNTQNQRNLSSAQKQFQSQQWQLDKLEKFKKQREKAAAAAAAKNKESQGDGKNGGAKPTTALSVLSTN